MRKKGKDFYYLFPGQGRGARQRYLRNLAIGLLVGTLTSALMAWLFYIWGR